MKKLLILLFLLVFSLNAFSWWNADWDYNKLITITANTALDQNFTVVLNLDTQTLISAGKMQADCDDLRIIYANTIDLNRFIKGCNSTDTNVLFRLQNIVVGSGTDKNYTLFYGNAAATNPPDNNNAVFRLNETFANLNNWSRVWQQGSSELQAGKLHLVRAKNNNGTNWEGYCFTGDNNVFKDFVLEFDLNGTGYGSRLVLDFNGCTSSGCNPADINHSIHVQLNRTTAVYLVSSEPTDSTLQTQGTGVNWVDSDFNHIKVEYKGSKNDLNYYQGNRLMLNNSGGFSASTRELGTICFIAHGNTTNDSNLFIKNVQLRNTVTDEPSYALSSEGTQTGVPVAPDLNVLYPMNLQNFLQGNLIDLNFSIIDLDTNAFDLNIDINYSLTRTQGTGTVIVNDKNLSTLSCDSNNLSTTRQCKYSWNTSIVPAGNYYVLAKVTDFNGETDFNAGQNTFQITVLPKLPDVNVLYPINSESFNIGTTIDLNFSIIDLDTNAFDMNIDINYSTSKTQGTGTVIVNDKNLATLNCDSNNLVTTRKCKYSWNTSAIPNGTYYILVKIKDQDANTDFNAGTGAFNITLIKYLTTTVLYPQGKQFFNGTQTIDINVSVVGAGDSNSDYNKTLWWQLWYSTSAGNKTNSLTSQKLYSVISPDQNSQGWNAKPSGIADFENLYDTTIFTEGQGSLKVHIFETTLAGADVDINKNIQTFKIIDYNALGKISFDIRTTCISCLALMDYGVFLTGLPAWKFWHLSIPTANDTWQNIILDLNSPDHKSGTPAQDINVLQFRIDTNVWLPTIPDFNVWIDNIKIYDNNGCPLFDGNSAKATQCKKSVIASSLPDGNYFIDANVSDLNTALGFDSFDSGNDYFIVDTNKPTTSWDGNNYIWQSIDANIHLTCIDVGGCGITTNFTGLNRLDFSHWTESDTAGILTITPTQITATNWEQQDYSNICKDYSLNSQAHYRFETSVTANSGLYSGMFLNLTNYAGTKNIGYETTNNYAGMGVIIDSSTPRIYAMATKNGSPSYSGNISISLNIPYYVDVVIDTTNITLKVYSDSNFSTQVGSTQTVGIISGTYDYICLIGRGRPFTDTISGYIQNLDLNMDRNIGTRYRLDVNSSADINYGAWQTYDSNIFISADGNYTIQFNSIDLAKNIGDTNTFYVLIDKTKPSIATTLLPVDGNYTNSVNITCSGITDVITTDLNYAIDENSTGAWIGLSDTNSCQYTWDITGKPADTKTWFRVRACHQNSTVCGDYNTSTIFTTLNPDTGFDNIANPVPSSTTVLTTSSAIFSIKADDASGVNYCVFKLYKNYAFIADYNHTSLTDTNKYSVTLTGFANGENAYTDIYCIDDLGKISGIVSTAVYSFLISSGTTSPGESSTTIISETENFTVIEPTSTQLIFNTYPGYKQGKFFVLKNSSTSKQTLKIKVSSEITNFILFEETEIEFQGLEQKNIFYTVQVPENTELGSYYGTITLNTKEFDVENKVEEKSIITQAINWVFGESFKGIPNIAIIFLIVFGGLFLLAIRKDFSSKAILERFFNKYFKRWIK